MYRQLSDPSVTCQAPGAAATTHARLSDCTLCAVRGRAICAALSPVEMQALDQATSSSVHAPGDTLVRAGEPRHHVYTVTSGALRMVRTLADGRRQITGFVLPGDYVGLTETPQHRHDIEAIVESRVCRTPMTQMRQLRERYPQLERKLLQRASMELAAAQDTGLVLARLQPGERLAHFLLRLAARSTQPGATGDTVALPMSRSDIADHLGLTMETVSRTFTKLRQQQLIALPQLHLVQILDYAALRSLAGETV
ncbi:Crp/Fnr family transcriptional regulator [Xanthomonas melonis]|uniref:CRP-like protein Clp n=2 Tax=Xanthomonas melonis TaxID=56456 RepID=A0A2S7DA41_9XANT|nr:Crp/Fnr family transcriptional regulator [Xanthomonas melonis]